MFLHVKGIESPVKNVANAIYLFVMTMQKLLLFVQIVFFVKLITKIFLIK